MGVDQPVCGAGRASPAKWSNANTGKKKSKKKCRSSGCRMQFGGAENGLLAKSGCKIQRHFLALPVRAIQGA
jgi:hypothetical protein